MAVTTQNIDTDNPEFQNLWHLVNYTQNSVFLTGKAGTGKSTFLRYVTEHTKKNYVVLAPTGIAAVNVGGMTLHSFFSLPFKPLMPDDPEFTTRNFRKRIRLTKAKIKLLKKLDLIIIDEISMVRADIIDFIDKILRTYCGNSRMPFAGKQLLLVGDVFQLEPVVTGDMRDILLRQYPNAFFFSAMVFREMKLVPIELRKVYRQDDGEFVSMLDRIRMGTVTDSDLKMLNSRLRPEADKHEGEGNFTMTLATRRDAVDSINERCLDSIKRPLITYIGTVTGEFPENSMPTTLELSLKVGAQVVFIKNDREGRWVNGSIAKVHRATKSTLEVEMEDGERHAIEPEVWENVQYSLDEKTGKIIEKTLGEFHQYPLRLAWALTIHKSQGLTFNNVEIDIGHGAFTSGQTYVALSRCRSLEGMTLRSTIAPRDIFINPAISRFSRSFNDDTLMANAITRAEADVAYRMAAKAIDEGRLVDGFEAFVEGLKHHSELSNPTAMRLARIKLHALAKRDDEIKSLKEQLACNEERFNALAEEYISMGYECVETGYDYHPALANFEKALSLAPDNVKALLGKAGVLKVMGEKDEAIATYVRVTQIDKLSINPLLRISAIYMDDEEWHEALDYALRAWMINKKDWAACSLLADIYDKVGDEDEAARFSRLAKKYKNGKRK